MTPEDRDSMFLQLGRIEARQIANTEKLDRIDTRVRRLENFKSRVLGGAAVVSVAVSYALSRIFPS